MRAQRGEQIVLILAVIGHQAAEQLGSDDQRGTLVTGKTTDELMRLLRSYEVDARDPGLK